VASPHPVVLDDRLLIEELFGRLPGRRPAGLLMTTTYWYYRACRAGVAGGSGHLGGPLAELLAPQRRDLVARLFELPDRIGLPDPRASVPSMAELAHRHPRLNLLNLEAAALGSMVKAVVWLSPESAAGVLPAVLDAEAIRWRVVAPRA
jgi:hypothetical protein